MKAMTNLLDKHPKLYHYTTLDGLKAILTEQRLRLSYIRSLNDEKELIAFRPRIRNILCKRVLDVINKKCNEQTKLDAFAREHGGRERIAKHLTNFLLNNLYKQLTGTQSTDPFIYPFIFSFCTPENKLIADNGLLSQWRGYGREAGYALVFDSKRLYTLVKDEAKEQRGLHLGTLGEVLYSDCKDENIRAELDEEIRTLESCVLAYLYSRDVNHLKESLESFVKSTCLYKHWGFSEEREFRLLVVTATHQELGENGIIGADIDGLKVQSFSRGNAQIPCIYLFDNQKFKDKKKLPVTQIIVGPHKDSDKNKSNLIQFLKSINLNNIKVTKSEIPYI